MKFEKKNGFFLILRIKSEASFVIFFYYCLNYCIYISVIVYSMKNSSRCCNAPDFYGSKGVGLGFYYP